MRVCGRWEGGGGGEGVNHQETLNLLDIPVPMEDHSIDRVT